jgi:hypothetical protein
MKNIIPALNKIQIACQDHNVPLSDIGLARKELFKAIRETIVQSLNLEIPQSTGGFVPVSSFVPANRIAALDKACRDFLEKFDKLNGE